MSVVLVTGANGLVGSSLCRWLTREGRIVRAMVRAGSDLRSLRGLSLERVWGDIRDADAVARAMKGVDEVYHTAAVISHIPAERRLMHDVNVGGTQAVVDEALRTGVSRFLHVSSIAAIGLRRDGQEITEDQPFDRASDPVSYRQTKAASEEVVRRGIDRGLDARFVNPSVIIGPGDFRFHGGRMIRDIARRRIFYAPPGGTGVVGVDDVARGAIRAMLIGRTGERYILNENNHSFRDLFRMTAEIVGGIPPIVTLPAPVVYGVAAMSEMAARLLNVRPWVTRELVGGTSYQRRYSNAKARRELGLSFTPVDRVIRETYRWYKQEELL